MLLSKVTYNEHISQKKGKQYVAVGTVRMFLEQSDKVYKVAHKHIYPFPIYNKEG